MDNKIIATIKLAEGQVGFYDPLSRIHLSMGNQIAYVKSGTNCAQLRRSVKSGRIRILNGTLGDEVAPFKVVKVNGKFKLATNQKEENKPVFAPEAAVTEEEAEAIIEAAEVPAAEETPVETAEAVEEVSEKVEEAAPEVKEEEPKKKNKKKGKKSSEE